MRCLAIFGHGMRYITKINKGIMERKKKYTAQLKAKEIWRSHLSGYYKRIKAIKSDLSLTENCCLLLSSIL